MADVATHSHTEIVCHLAPHIHVYVLHVYVHIHIDMTVTVLLLSNRYPVQIAPLVRVQDPKCIAALWGSYNAR